MMIPWYRLILLASAVAAKQPWSLLPRDVGPEPRNVSATSNVYTDEQVFEATLDAVRVMQGSYFQPWVGTWPKAIDWTAAVMGSHIAGALTSLSRGLGTKQNQDIQVQENLISYYFTQLISFYFGQNALSLRHQAFDDMLWVVLNWLDAVQFINEWSTTRPSARALNNTKASAEVASEALRQQFNLWYGNEWVPSFAHRARIFWELGLEGWDETLCGGGMFWNPRLGPYKNAITNELFIAASATMYKHFPGDTNSSPYDFHRPMDTQLPDTQSEEWMPHDPKYFTYARKAYNWLMASNMTNDQGLFTDGFHMSNYPGNNTRCDRRDEMVYTYNQGVILTGQRELFRATGARSYIREGHRLIQNVIRATGWNLGEDAPYDNIKRLGPGELPPHRGLGRAGILEEVCDPSGKCSQNSHTFKGIWMHHFTAFCAPLDMDAAYRIPTLSDDFFDETNDPVSPKDFRKSHSEACKRYLPWIRHNAYAAMNTRNREGKFGMWWTVGLLNLTTDNLKFDPESQPGPKADDPAELVSTTGTDYRTYGIPQTELWMGTGDKATAAGAAGDDDGVVYPAYNLQGIVAPGNDDGVDYGVGDGDLRKRDQAASSDPNDRYRGRTVETQGGGVAVLRALWQLLNQDESVA